VNTHRLLDPRSSRPLRGVVTLLWAAAALAVPCLAGAQDFDFPFITPGATGQLVRPQAPDQELIGILGQVNPSNLQQTVRTLVGFGTRHTLSSQTDPARGIGAATNFVFTQLQTAAAQSNGRMTVQLQSFVHPPSPQLPTPTTITNVIATIQGSVSPARTYVLTAFLDSRVTNVLNFTSDAPGADSDASGVAAIIELARILATHQPKSTIILATVDGKEQGLYGSSFQAAQLKAAGADVEGMFSVDRIGSSIAEDGTRDPFTLRLFSEGVPTAAASNQGAILQEAGGEDDSASRQLGRFAVSVAENIYTSMRIRHIYRRDRIAQSSDQVPYQQQSYPAARFAEANENFAHEDTDVAVVNGVQFGDLPEFLDYGYLARATRVCAAVIWSLSQGPATPKNVLMHITPLNSNDTNLSWDAGTDADLAGYEVVWRETSDEDWTRVIQVGNVTSAHLAHLSKDNVLFGVRAVDSSGHHSPVSFPVPTPQ
jgi:hypothetical protein